jgi:rubrerythrin
MKAIITNESKVLSYQESLDRMKFDLTKMIKNPVLVTNSGFMDIENLQALLDKSIPMKITSQRMMFGGVWLYHCTKCGYPINKRNYCPNCGQKLRSDSNE